MTQEHIQMFYDHPLEPERRKLLALWLRANDKLSGADVYNAEASAFLEFKELTERLNAVNDQMKRDFRAKLADLEAKKQAALDTYHGLRTLPTVDEALARYHELRAKFGAA